MSQKIVIPKGLINPNETTIIEIPYDVKNIETVVAKPLTEEDLLKSSNTYYEYCDPGAKSCIDITSEDDSSLDWNDMNFSSQAQCSIRSSYKYTKSMTNLETSPYIYMPPKQSLSGFKIAPKKSTWKYVPSNMNVNVKYTKSKSSYVKVTKNPPPKLSSKDLTTLLDAMDNVECNKLQKCLREYHIARRRLFYETMKLKTADDVSEIFKSFLL